MAKLLTNASGVFWWQNLDFVLALPLLVSCLPHLTLITDWLDQSHNSDDLISSEHVKFLLSIFIQIFSLGHLTSPDSHNEQQDSRAFFFLISCQVKTKSGLWDNWQRTGTVTCCEWSWWMIHCAPDTVPQQTQTSQELPMLSHVTLYWRVTMNVEIVDLNCLKCNQVLRVASL